MNKLALIVSLTLAYPALAQVYQVAPPSEIAQPAVTAQAVQVASPEQSDPGVSAVAPAEPAETSLAVVQAALNKQLSERNRKLRDENARLVDENARLTDENAALQTRVGDLTRLGGSEVHAYCAAGSNTISRNTAGAESNCALAGYSCEQVSGLCRTSCQSSDMCSPGSTCQVEDQRCVPSR
jgi:hypothetical protein